MLVLLLVKLQLFHFGLKHQRGTPSVGVTFTVLRNSGSPSANEYAVSAGQTNSNYYILGALFVTFAINSVSSNLAMLTQLDTPFI
jgi:hypothetical protein